MDRPVFGQGAVSYQVTANLIGNLTLKGFSYKESFEAFLKEIETTINQHLQTACSEHGWQLVQVKVHPDGALEYTPSEHTDNPCWTYTLDAHVNGKKYNSKKMSIFMKFNQPTK